MNSLVRLLNILPVCLVLTMQPVNATGTELSKEFDPPHDIKILILNQAKNGKSILSNKDLSAVRSSNKKWREAATDDKVCKPRVLLMFRMPQNDGYIGDGKQWPSTFDKYFKLSSTAEQILEKLRTRKEEPLNIFQSTYRYATQLLWLSNSSEPQPTATYFTIMLNTKTIRDELVKKLLDYQEYHLLRNNDVYVALELLGDNCLVVNQLNWGKKQTDYEASLAIFYTLGSPTAKILMHDSLPGAAF